MAEQANLANESLACVSLNDYLWEVTRDLSTRYSTMAIFASFYATIIVCGVFGNLCVILAVAKNKQLQTVPNLFIVSLSCSDIVVCLTSGTITPFTAFAKVWVFGSALCAIMGLISGVSLFFSTFTLTAISIDRFILIVLPTQQPIQQRHCYLIIASILTLAVGLSLPIATHQTVGPFGNYCGVFCSEDWHDSQWGRKAYGTFVLVLQFALPLIVICTCYTLICIKISNGILAKRDRVQTTLLSKQRQAAVKRRQRTNRMLIGMVCGFATSWSPYIVFNLSRDYNLWPEWVQQQQFLLGIVTHCIAMTSTVWNPLLYAWLNQQLRAAFLQLLGCEPLTTDGDANFASRMSSVRSRKRSSEAHLRDPATATLLVTKQHGMLGVPVLQRELPLEKKNSDILDELIDRQSLLDDSLQHRSGDISL